MINFKFICNKHKKPKSGRCCAKEGIISSFKKASALGLAPAIGGFLLEKSNSKKLLQTGNIACEELS